MSNLEKASRLLQDWADMHSVDMDMYHVARKLLEAELLAPDVQVIRTLEELQALDPDGIVVPSAPEGFEHDATRAESLLYVVSRWGWKDRLPAAVIATGAQVRAAREAMEQDND